MSKHGAMCFRQHRRAQGILEHDPFSVAKFVQRATELRRLEQLPWPTNLFGQPVSIAELMAEGSPDHTLEPTHLDGDGYDRIHDAAAYGI